MKEKADVWQGTLALMILKTLETLGPQHDAPGGGIVVRPWGERSFYVEDPWKNPLCFVEEGTVYTG